MRDGQSDATGHLFVINSDLTRVQCDAVLLPTATDLLVEAWAAPLIRQTGSCRLPVKPSGDWTETAVAQWRGPTSGPAVWLGCLGGNEFTPVEQFIACAERFVRTAARELDRSRITTVLPTLALPVVGTGRGGGAARRGEILLELIPRLITLASEERVDIVLVTHGRVTYEAAQTVRRLKSGTEEQLWPDLDASLRMAAGELADHARSGNLVVFVGAGVSATAGLPAWQSLLDRVGTDLGLDEEAIVHMHALDVRDQAALLSKHQANFKTAVDSALRASHFSLLHGLLASLPVREFVTTNFDTLLEGASKSPGNELTIVPGNPIRPSSRWLVKLHGTLGSDLVLTRADYRDVRSQRGALFGLLQALLVTKHMLFVGYSMQDEDFNDVVHDIRALHAGNDVETSSESPDRAEAPESNSTTELFGTVLMPFGNSKFTELWSDMRVLAARPPMTIRNGRFDDPTPVQWAEAVRQLTLFVDLVGMKSASEVRFVTDKDFKALNTEEGTALAEAVRLLRDVYETYCDDSKRITAPHWAEVRAALDSFDVLRSSLLPGTPTA